jgi:hypothetical protein
MVNILLFTYYYKYKQARKVIRDLIDIDIEQAQTKLNQNIQEHDNYVTNNNSPISLDQDTFTKTDNLSLHHAKDHLDAFQQDTNQNIIQKDAATKALEELEI